jgi:hypothetical protein
MRDSWELFGKRSCDDRALTSNFGRRVNDANDGRHRGRLRFFLHRPVVRRGRVARGTFHHFCRHTSYRRLTLFVTRTQK